MAHIVYKGRNLQCVPNTAMRGINVGVGPKEVIVAFAVNIRKELFFTVDTDQVSVDADVDPYTSDYDLRRPVSGVTAQYKSKPYKVSSVSEDPTGTFYTLTMADANSGR